KRQCRANTPARIVLTHRCYRYAGTGVKTHMLNLREMHLNALWICPLPSRPRSFWPNRAGMSSTKRTLFNHLHRTVLQSRILASMLVAIALAACSQASQTPPAPQATEVSVVTVQRQPVPVFTELPGRTSAYLVAQVRARVDGIVLKREFQEGADIKANQRLYQID